ncbi:MAG: DUF922 domain-containing Zn-dependent protease [Chitinophagaceae bacterium]|nr:DUF922 domain-containing Zn-dependent protease [Chitinophagaceae bacterium]
MKNVLLLFTLIHTVPTLSGQPTIVNILYQNLTSKPDGDTIYYKPGLQLTWADFKGKPNLHSNTGAVTSSGISLQSSIQQEETKIIITLQVYAYFDKKSSWKKPNVHDAYHLTHEQNHLDITYLGAIELIRRLKLEKFTMQNFSETIDRVCEEVNSENDHLQNQYDRETNFSINTSQQEIWNQKVRKMLKEATNQPHPEG